MKTTKEIKTAAKKYFDFYKKNFTKLNTVKMELAPGFVVTGKYFFTPYGDIDFEELTYKASKETKALFEALNIDIEQQFWDVNLQDQVSLEPIDTLDDLARELNEAVFDGNDSADWQDYIDSDTELAYFYEVVEDFIIDADQKPESIRVTVSNDYSANVIKGQHYIQVGCQRVTIENIRNILAKYEEVNS